MFLNCGERPREGGSAFGRHFAWLKYFTHPLVPVLAPNYKQHILSPALIREICYSLAELYVKYVYLHLIGRRGGDVYETFSRGAHAVKFWEHLAYIKLDGNLLSTVVMEMKHEGG
jgi:hypothetical protein